MSNERTITRTQLVAAFTEWEKSRRSEPAEYERAFDRFEAGPPEVVAEVQADQVFEYLDESEKTQ